jgi:hypothetical protein
MVAGQIESASPPAANQTLKPDEKRNAGTPDDDSSQNSSKTKMVTTFETLATSQCPAGPTLVGDAKFANLGRSRNAANALAALAGRRTTPGPHLGIMRSEDSPGRMWGVHTSCYGAWKLPKRGSDLQEKTIAAEDHGNSHLQPSTLTSPQVFPG